MSQFVTNDLIADILDGIGKTGAAANLRAAGEESETPAELAEQLADASEELAKVQVLLGQLEGLLCKTCAKKWKTL